VHRAWALASTILHSFPIVEGSFDCLKISGLAIIGMSLDRCASLAVGRGAPDRQHSRRELQSKHPRTHNKVPRCRYCCSCSTPTLASLNWVFRSRRLRPNLNPSRFGQTLQAPRTRSAAGWSLGKMIHTHLTPQSSTNREHHAGVQDNISISAGGSLPMILLEKIRLIWFRVSELFNDLIRVHVSLPAHVSW
jgi:hypothetical protein